MPELKYHHIGIPTDRELPEEDEVEDCQLYAPGDLENPYGIEWMNFDKDESRILHSIRVEILNNKNQIANKFQHSKFKITAIGWVH